MTQMTLTGTGLQAGQWEGVLTGAGSEAPALQVTLGGDVLAPPDLTRDADANTWRVRVNVPADRISDGLQTFVISDDAGQLLASFSLMVGEALAEDIRAEMDLLRAELDLLKSAFRRHCSES